MKIFYYSLFAAVFSANLHAQMPDSIYKFFPMDSNGTYWVYRYTDGFTNEIYGDRIIEITGDTMVGYLHAKKVRTAILGDNGNGKQIASGPYYGIFYLDRASWTVYASRCLHPSSSCNNDSLDVMINLKNDTAATSCRVHQTWDHYGGCPLSVLKSYDGKHRQYGLGDMGSGTFFASTILIFEKGIGITDGYMTVGEGIFNFQGGRNEFGGDDNLKKNFWKEFERVGVNDELQHRKSLSLVPNSPNPFSSSTLFSYYLPYKESVQLKIYSSLGNEIATLVNGKEEEGFHSHTFRSQGLAAGIYMYELRAGTFRQARQMVLVK